jgi:signal transduction histidine kinase
MRLSIKAKQVIGVTSMVGLAVVALSALYAASLVRISLEESRARGELLSDAIFHRSREVVAASADPYAALHADAGVRSILQSSVYSNSVTYAAIVNVSGVAIAHSDERSVGQPIPPHGDLADVLRQGPLAQLRAIYSDQGRTLEIKQPLLMENVEFGSIRIGVSTLLIRRELDAALRPALATALVALLVGTLVAMVLAQVLLRPIHLIRTGLTRLGRGESGLQLNLSRQDEFGELGDSFNAVSAQLSAARTQLVGQSARLESVMEHLEDAVGIFGPDGELLFANSAMRAVLPAAPRARPDESASDTAHPYLKLVGESLRTLQPGGPVAVRVEGEPGGAGHSGTDADAAGERLLTTHLIEDSNRRLVGVMLVARNLEYLSQVQSTLSYSRKLAALGRLSAGVAHQVKNPLNAMLIHLELLKQQLWHDPSGSRMLTGGAPGGDSPIDLSAAAEHVSVIGEEIHRLDEVVQSFLKFTRPVELSLEIVTIGSLLQKIMPIVEAEARDHHIDLQVDCPPHGFPVRADAAMLQQSFLNLALNACQAMPAGGELRITAAGAPARRVAVVFQDTGVGIPPEHLGRIFDLYFTTKERGSGIGLSMVYRTVQLHDGEIEVQSTPGRGTTFRVLLPRA